MFNSSSAHPRRWGGFSLITLVPRRLHEEKRVVAFRPTTRSGPRLGLAARSRLTAGQNKPHFDATRPHLGGVHERAVFARGSQQDGNIASRFTSHPAVAMDDTQELLLEMGAVKTETPAPPRPRPRPPARPSRRTVSAWADAVGFAFALSLRGFGTGGARCFRSPWRGFLTCHIGRTGSLHGRRAASVSAATIVRGARR